MALKKKGTYEKIKIVKESEAERFERLIKEAHSFDGEFGKTITLTSEADKKKGKK